MVGRACTPCASFLFNIFLPYRSKKINDIFSSINKIVIDTHDHIVGNESIHIAVEKKILNGLGTTIFLS